MAANAGDLSTNIRPTEAQLRWAQFHHKRRAHGVKLLCQRLYETPRNPEDVPGAYPEDGNSTTSISDAEFRERRPKVSKGRRAYLRVSKRNYNKRIESIRKHGFKKLEGADTFSDGEDEEDLNEIFMTKRRRMRRKGVEADERLRRFQEACHAMMMNLAQPEEQFIVVPSKRWTRTADHIAASAALEEEYWDPKWGIRRSILPGPQIGSASRFNPHHPAEMPLDKGASWLVHMPNHVSSSRENPSRSFYITDPSQLPDGSVISDGFSEGGETVSTLTMRAPGRQKFNQLVALAQQRLIERGVAEQKYFQDARGQGPELHSDTFGGNNSNNPKLLFEASPMKSKKSYMPRMRLRDFMPNSDDKNLDDEDDEMNLKELTALNQIPREKYLEAVQQDTGRRQSHTQEMAHSFEANKARKKVVKTLAIAKSYEESRHQKMRLRKFDEELKEVGGAQVDLHPEELVIMNKIVGIRLKQFDIAIFEDRSQSLDRADQIIQNFEAENKGNQVSRLRDLFYSMNQDDTNSEDSSTEPVRVGDAMALQQIIRVQIERFQKQGTMEQKRRLARAQEMALAFEADSTAAYGQEMGHSTAAYGQETGQGPTYENIQPFEIGLTDSIEGNKDDIVIGPEELVVMQKGINAYKKAEQEHRTDGEIHHLAGRAEEVAQMLEGVSKERANRSMKEMFHVLRESEGKNRHGRTLELEELFVLQKLVDSRVAAIESSNDEEMLERLKRTKLLASLFEGKTKDQTNSRIKELVESLEQTGEPTTVSRKFSFHAGRTNSAETNNELPRKRESEFFDHIRRINAREMGRFPQGGEISIDQQEDPHLCEDWQRAEIRQRHREAGVRSTVSPANRDDEIKADAVEHRVSDASFPQDRDSRVSSSTHSNRSGDSAAENLLNRGRSNQSSTALLPTHLKETAANVSDRVNLFFQNSHTSSHHQDVGGAVSGASVSQRVHSFFQSSMSGSSHQSNEKQTSANLKGSAGNVSERVSTFFQTIRTSEDEGLEERQYSHSANESSSTFNREHSAEEEQSPLPTRRREQKILSSSSQRGNRVDGDSDIGQPIPPQRSKAEQEIHDAVEASTPERNRHIDYAPDEFDADFLAAYHKKRESTASTDDDGSSVSSFQALPSGYREVVKSYTPTRKSRASLANGPVTKSQLPPKHSDLSAENLKTFSEMPLQPNSFDHGIIDTDDTTSQTSDPDMNPSLLSSLMLSPDLLTKRHKQAVRAIEMRQWDDVNYLLNANPWLAEMSELTTKQYLLHKIAFFGTGATPAPLELCQQLMVKFPAAVHKFDEDGNVPLHLAAAAGHLKMIKMLGEEFESGASIRNEDGMLPLHFTIASYGYVGGANADNENGTNSDNMGPVHVIKTVLKFFPQAVAIGDNDGNLPIHIAVECLEGRIALDVIDLLLDEAERQLQDPYGARFYNKVKVEEILSDGLQPDPPAEDIDAAEPDTHCNMVRNNHGESPLLAAIHARKGWQIIEMLVSRPGGREAALHAGTKQDNALHLLVGEFQDPTAALSVLKHCPETSTLRNIDGMLPIEVACMQLMPEEVILAIALSDLHIDINDKEGKQVRPEYGGSWWFLTCECDDHYVEIVQELVSMCSFQQVRLLCLMEGGSVQNKGTVISRATPKCREVLSQAIRFMGRFEFVGNAPLYSDPDVGLKAFDGLDFGNGIASTDEGRRVVLNCYSMREPFLQQIANLHSHNLDVDKVEEVVTFSVNDGGAKNTDLPQQFWMSIERPEVTLRDVADSMVRKGGYWNEPELRSKYAAKVCSVLRIVAKSLRHLHLSGVIHGDMNLSSVGKFDRTWKLLGRLGLQDLDHAFDMSRFQQSFPPEALHSVDQNSATCDSDAPVRFKDSIVTSPAIDIWAFGKLAYEAIMGKPLVEFGSKKPSEDMAALLDVMEWDESNMKDVFTELLEAGGIGESGAELFTSCLFPRPEARPASMELVLSHEFWHENHRKREKSKRRRRRRNTDSVSANSKSLFTESD